ncbi:MAG: Uncharacterised protein [Bacteroidota bacterium]|nr:MAG: Uncharacterised protein [Bacteroidota bacterium]
MEEKKIIQNNVEQELMSLAHEILRSRNRMELADIHAKASAIVALTTPKTADEAPQTAPKESAPTELEEALLTPVLEAEFETMSIDFTQHLFEGSNADYQRVMSMLKSKETLEEAKKFIETQIQPDYDWSDKQKEIDAFMSYVETLFDS